MCKKNQKYCPSLVVMLRTLCNMRNKEICDLLGYTSSAVGNIISRHELADKIHYRNIDKDAVEAEYLAGATTYELADKYGVAHQTIGKWMKKRGHIRGKGNVRGKGHGRKLSEQQLIAFTEAGRAAKYEKNKTVLEQRIKEKTGGKIELISYQGRMSDFRCTECGRVFTRKSSDALRFVFTCLECRKKETEKANELKKQQRIREHQERLAAEYAKPKICATCGTEFHSIYETSKYCSDKCKAYLRDSTHRARSKRHGVEYDSTITWRSLSKELGHCNCQICGEPCDPNDTSWGNFGPLYPTVDCIVPMAKGGGYVHGNVQLAHAICNSCKRDLTDDELMDEVITHAKEQAIAHKCA